MLELYSDQDAYRLNICYNRTHCEAFPQDREVTAELVGTLKDLIMFSYHGQRFSQMSYEC